MPSEIFPQKHLHLKMSARLDYTKGHTDLCKKPLEGLLVGQGAEGRRFSLNYLGGGEPSADSKRMRQRLATQLVQFDFSRFALLVTKELGVKVPHDGKYGFHWEQFFRDAELRDILDTITLYHNHLKSYWDEAQAQKNAQKWLKEVDRVFREENVRYAVDQSGGVHFFVDQEFEARRAAALSVLQSARYANVLAGFEDAYKAFDRSPPDGKWAIRAIFAASEGLFRLMFPKASILGVDELNKFLRPVIEQRLSGDKAATGAANKMITSLREWVIAAHNYRHEQGSEEPAQPPLDLAILMVSQGAGFIRWLAELDQQVRSAGAA
jgi:hypothetical protein